jgi:molybdopterin biosynthesis enzyme
MERFGRAMTEKIGWFGGTLIEPHFVPSDADALREAIEAIIADGARIVAVAGSRAMDPLDPIFGALDAVGALMIRQGMPAHPGSLCWLATARSCILVGMPSCGLFSQATVFDLVLTRLFGNDPVDAHALSLLGHGGFLTRDMAFRFPPYRRARERGEVE